MTVGEAQQICNAIFDGNSFEALSETEYRALMAISNAIDGNPLSQNMPYKDALFIQSCAAKASSLEAQKGNEN